MPPIQEKASSSIPIAAIPNSVYLNLNRRKFAIMSTCLSIRIMQPIKQIGSIM